MIYIRKIYNQDLENNHQMQIVKEPAWSFFDYHYNPSEKNLDEKFFTIHLGCLYDKNGETPFHAEPISTRIYMSSSTKKGRINCEARLGSDLRSFLKNNYRFISGDILVFKNKIGKAEPDYDNIYVDYVSTDSILYKSYDMLLNKENHSVNVVSPSFPIQTYQNTRYSSYLTAIRTKPFLLLAGISGTGKSRLVRQLARACDIIDDNPKMVQKPANFEMVQVKPNWHDSSELIGYISRIDGEKFIVGDFLKFIVKAWYNADVPFFLCLDEMNLAPVEQYFAEYLSVIESRRLQKDGKTILTDPIIRPEYEKEKNDKTGENIAKPWYDNLIKELLTECPVNQYFGLYNQFKDLGISIPRNLIVIGTVNMDETTYSFSRKVLDRAMTIEMNEVDLLGGLSIESNDDMGTITPNQILADCVEGKDVYVGNEEICNKVIRDYLQPVNEVLEGTPFKIAYRTRNEFLLYVINSIRLNKDKVQNEVIVKALDEVTGMKILSRIEGDETKVSTTLLDALRSVITDGFKIFVDADYTGFKVEGKTFSVSLAKLKTMSKKLHTCGYTSFWD